MTMFARGVRRPSAARGPYPATVQDIPGLNTLFSSSFTDRYRKDGFVGVHVPHLNPMVWRFALEDAAGGAMLWRGEKDEVVAFNVAHRSGVEGWMGPLAVAPEYQGRGVGQSIVNAGIDWLRANDVSVIGLETMPRTVDNIGFYSALGFTPGYLTLTMTIEAEYADRRMTQLSRVPSGERVDVMAACGMLVKELAPGYDFTRELLITDALGIGDTILLERGSLIDGFALCHSVPLVDGRAREELRVLKLVARHEDDCDLLITQLADYARRCGARRVAIRVQGEYHELYRRLIQRGARVRWTDLRMSLDGYQEWRPVQGIVLSNWEI